MVTGGDWNAGLAERAIGALLTGITHLILSPVYLVRWQRRRKKQAERREQRRRVADALEIARIESERRRFRAKRKRAIARRWHADGHNGIHLSH